MNALARNEAMTRLKKIKGAFLRLWQLHERLRFPCVEFTFEKKWLPNEGVPLKATCIMFARRRQTLLSPLISHSLIGVCSSQEYRYPGEKTSPFFARKAVLFPVVLANARVSLWIIEKGAQCALCIVEVSKDLCHHQNGRSVFRRSEFGTVLA